MYGNHISNGSPINRSFTEEGAHSDSSSRAPTSGRSRVGDNTNRSSSGTNQPSASNATNHLGRSITPLTINIENGHRPAGGVREALSDFSMRSNEGAHSYLGGIATMQTTESMGGLSGPVNDDGIPHGQWGNQDGTITIHYDGGFIHSIQQSAKVGKESLTFQTDLHDVADEERFFTNVDKFPRFEDNFVVLDSNNNVIGESDLKYTNEANPVPVRVTAYKTPGGIDVYEQIKLDRTITDSEKPKKIIRTEDNGQEKTTTTTIFDNDREITKPKRVIIEKQFGDDDCSYTDIFDYKFDANGIGVIEPYTAPTYETTMGVEIEMPCIKVSSPIQEFKTPNGKPLPEGEMPHEFPLFIADIIGPDNRPIPFVEIKIDHDGGNNIVECVSSSPLSGKELLKEREVLVRKIALAHVMEAFPTENKGNESNSVTLNSLVKKLNDNPRKVLDYTLSVRTTGKEFDRFDKYYNINPNTRNDIRFEKVGQLQETRMQLTIGDKNEQLYYRNLADKLGEDMPSAQKLPSEHWHNYVLDGRAADKMVDSLLKNSEFRSLLAQNFTVNDSGVDALPLDDLRGGINLLINQMVNGQKKLPSSGTSKNNFPLLVKTSMSQVMMENMCTEVRETVKSFISKNENKASFAKLLLAQVNDRLHQMHNDGVEFESWTPRNLLNLLSRYNVAYGNLPINPRDVIKDPNSLVLFISNVFNSDREHAAKFTGSLRPITGTGADLQKSIDTTVVEVRSLSNATADSTDEAIENIPKSTWYGRGTKGTMSRNRPFFPDHVQLLNDGSYLQGNKINGKWHGPVQKINLNPQIQPSVQYFINGHNMPSQLWNTAKSIPKPSFRIVAF